MTDREKAIVMAYTGACMLTGDKLQIFHKYVEKIMGRPIWTHEMAQLADEIKEKSKDDFIALCADEGGSENPYKWTPVSESLPEETGTLGGYLVSIGYWVGIAHFVNGKFWNDYFRQTLFEFPVEAWLPLPKPYRTESEGNNEI